MPGSALKTIPLIWPFAVWGLDMVGKFKTAPGGYTHLLVAVDKFTKWVEAKPIKKCDGKTATKFLRELIYRYGYPHSIITDNGTNFAKGEMADFCEEKGIRLDFASVAHPESNGQAERVNQSILHGLKRRLVVPLERAAGCWAEELPSVLWGIRTTPNRSTDFTPFFLVYGAEAVMPTDIAYGRVKTAPGTHSRVAWTSPPGHGDRPRATLYSTPMPSSTLGWRLGTLTRDPAKRTRARKENAPQNPLSLATGSPSHDEWCATYKQHNYKLTATPPMRLLFAL
ncbi:hypothetical protein QYE76_008003 [Lolium multiflorum]|uniref:Integrase catalytic domain-containing protein n=1 Tax=Lolium multiflorum TaxID=4521 RepID=A0AAD8QL68_LOLMU|nr:hypothetical protein QYE76_008003 [Lolium multiflorum]